MPRRMHGSKVRLARWAGIVMVGGISLSALAQPFRPPAPDPNQRQVYLVRQDFSDCTNSNIPNVDSPAVGGNVWVTRQGDVTRVQVAMTASPKTTYHFFLKCVRQLGDITTDDEGVANASFSFPTNLAGPVFAFDMYPNGAPAGNKFQSAQVKFQ
jgi:hypothetical protein